jgi:hypothetical protein
MECIPCRQTVNDNGGGGHGASGDISELLTGFDNLMKLQYLDVSMNKLTGVLTELRMLTKLVSLPRRVGSLGGR